MSDRRLTYLASPYSSPDPEVRAARFRSANLAAGLLMREGHLVVSPISMNHPIAESCNLPLGWGFWRAFDIALVNASERVVVLCLDGWRESVGVAAEIGLARRFGLPVRYVRVTDGRLVWSDEVALASAPALEV
jgi:hypothetical protein